MNQMNINHTILHAQTNQYHVFSLNGNPVRLRTQSVGNQ